MLLEVEELLLEDLDNYINIVSKSFKLNNYNDIINKIYYMFNITVTLEQIEEYYSPNISEIEIDLKLQFKNLGLLQ